MPGSARAEVYFIAAMMILIVVLCVAATYAFFKTYRSEMRAKEKRIADAKETAKQNAEKVN